MVSEKVKCLRFSISPWTAHLPGQYYGIKLVDRADNFVEKYYSVANSNTETGVVELGVQLIEGGEVSPTLHMLQSGDSIFIKGPLGSHFSWIPHPHKDITFIAGGSGIVPFMSFLRTHRIQNVDNRILLLASFKNVQNTPYFNEISKTHSRFQSFITLTQESGGQWKGAKGRITKETILTYKEALNNSQGEIFVCGSSRFVEAMVGHLKSVHIHSKVNVEMFG